MSNSTKAKLPSPPTSNGMGALHELIVQPHWRVIDVISDVHLEASEPALFLAWRRYIETSSAHAILILGDLFEAWIGDDVLGILTSLPNRHEGLCFEDRALRTLRFASERVPLFFMPGNRDFLLGDDALAACAVTRLADPCVLKLGDAKDQRLLLSHGDAWCTDDGPYMEFRQMVRTAKWQSDFLARPLPQRRELVRSIRAQSILAQQKRITFVDVNAETVHQAALQYNCQTIIHGHTHEGASHVLAMGAETLQRHVTTDWRPLRESGGRPSGVLAQALRLTITPKQTWHIQRIEL